MNRYPFASMAFTDKAYERHTRRPAGSIGVGERASEPFGFAGHTHTGRDRIPNFVVAKQKATESVIAQAAAKLRMYEKVLSGVDEKGLVVPLVCYVDESCSFEFYESLKANWLPDWRSALSGFRGVVTFPDELLKAKSERRGRAPEAFKVKAKFAPSYDLCRFVLLVDEPAPKEGKHAELTEDQEWSRRRHIHESVFGLLQTVADGLVRQGVKEYKIASEGRFEELFAKALLFRIRVAVYGQIAFLNMLFKELSSSEVFANGWRLKAGEMDSLVLSISAEKVKLDRVPRKRATPVRLKMTHFADE